MHTFTQIQNISWAHTVKYTSVFTIIYTQCTQSNALYNEHTKWLTLLPTQPLLRNKLNGQLIP